MTNQAPSHPYFPLGASIQDYMSNESSALALLAKAGGCCLLLLGSVLGSIWYSKPGLSRGDTLAILWFVLSGFLHVFFEGYFVLNHERLAASQNLFAQLWKEYALSDSRYLTSDTLVLCLETMTACLWGPLCLAVAYSICIRHPLRHPLQIIICVCHLYGDALYYATSLFDHYVNGRTYCRPEPYYFWLYYFFMNFLWIVIPSYYLYDSVSKISKCLKSIEKLDKGNDSMRRGVARSPLRRG